MRKNLHLFLTVLVLLTFGLLFPKKGQAQEMAALSFSNYSGISGAWANPAFLTGSKVYMDFRLVGGHVFFDNNFAYIPKDSTNFWKLLRSDSIPQPYGKYGYNSFYTYYKNRKYNNLAAVVSAMAPAFMLQAGKHAFGISFNARSYNSFHQFPNAILETLYKGSPDPSYNDNNTYFRNLNFASLSWMELGFHYAYDFYNRYGNKFTAGVSLKLLYGVEGFYTSIKTLKYHSLSNKQVQIDTLDGTVGFALPVEYTSNPNAKLNPFTKGHGIGLDVGFLFTKNTDNVSGSNEKQWCAIPYQDYKYRIGFSIMDIGRIRFKDNAQLHEYNVKNKLLTDVFSTNFSGINSVMQTISYELYGDSLASLKDSVFNMSLPTAMSFQMDYHFKKNLYISGFWIQPLRFQNKSLRRPAQLLVMPRYETRMLGVSLPVSWYDYQKLRVGLALRIYSVTIGTEKLGTFLGMGDLTGMDLYVNVKINLLKGACASWKKDACYGDR